jgi:hypothetical protein
VIDSLQRLRLRHWPLFVATIAWLVVAWVPALFRSEVVRAALAVTCIALMAFQWVLYRKTVDGSKFLLLSLIVAWFTLASLWLSLNVVRYYTYNPESARTWAWHTLVAQIQTPIAWAMALLIPVVFTWVLGLFVHWISSRVRNLPSRPKV